MGTKQFGRRQFLGTSGGIVGSTWLASVMPLVYSTALQAGEKRDQQATFSNLTRPEAADLAAVAEQILPQTETPGAQELGVIWFIDEALGGFRKPWGEPVRSFVQTLNDQLPDGQRLAQLGFAEQTRLLKQHEQHAAFSMLQFLTVAGAFSMPGYGGNRDQLGWQLIGFQPVHGWQPPFGFYDTPAQQGEPS